MTGREDGRYDDARQPRLLFLARRWSVAARAELETITRDHGMTAGDYSLLHLIARRAPCSSADIARFARITPQASTQQVAQLAAKQMIVRNENPDNRRIMLIEATQRGRDALKDIDRRALALETRLTEGLDPAELDIIRRFLSRDPGAAAEPSIFKPTSQEEKRNDR